MLFIVPDANSKEDGSAPGGIKVELDLDDAPFLQEDEPEPQAEPEPESEKIELPSAEGDKKDSDKPAGNRKKRLIFAGAAAVVLAIVAVVVNMFLFGGEEKPTAPSAPEPVYEVVSTTPPKEEPVKPPYAHLVQWETFQVEQRGEDGGIRFVTCKIAIPAADDAQYMELMAKRIVLRDAVYYFLRNRPPEILSTKEKNLALRADIVGVLNGHLSATVKDVYIEEYVVIDPNRP